MPAASNRQTVALAARRERGLVLRKEKARLMREPYRRFTESGMSGEQLVAEIDKAIREVRKEMPLHERTDR